jgi:hypothetical protein
MKLPMKSSKILLILLSISLVACLGDKAPDTPDTPDTSNPIIVQDVGRAVEDCDQPLESYTNFQQVYNECITWDESANKGTLEVKYRSNDVNSTGLGIRIHYDSMELEFKAFSFILSKDNIFSTGPYNDEDNFDNDTKTDKYIDAGWSSLFGEWPGAGMIDVLGYKEITLMNIEFDRVDNSTENYAINYTSSSSAATLSLILGK